MIIHSGRRVRWGHWGRRTKKQNKDSLVVHLSINRARAVVDVDSVPATEWDAIGKFGLEADDPLGTARPASRSEIEARFFWTISARAPRFSSRGQHRIAYSVRCYAVDSTLVARRGGPLRAVEVAMRGMQLIMDFVPWVEHPGVPRQ